jgi:hypothetical protein
MHRGHQRTQPVVSGGIKLAQMTSAMAIMSPACARRIR